MLRLLFFLLLTMLVAIQATANQPTANAFKRSPVNVIPKSLTGLPNDSIATYTGVGQEFLLLKNVVHQTPSVLRLPLPSGEETFKVQNRVNHSNGDVTLIGLLQLDNSDYRMIYTVGPDGGIADISGPQARVRLHVESDRVFSVDLTHAKIQNRSGADDLIESIHGKALRQAQQRQTHSSAKKDSTERSSNNNTIVVDAYLLYTPNIVAAYPGTQSDTLMNHVVAVTNQAFVDSEVDVYLRLVGTDFVNYTKPSDFDALSDLDSALTNPASTDSSLTNVLARRNALGADLVAMIRTHDLNERGVCGVAYFPNSEHDILINISNVGSSGGSHCFDTFTHEVGHNFGAGHQWRNGSSVGFFDYSGALIRQGKFNTIMSSIGTGDINRNYGLNKFSNPDIQCGGTVCGDATWGNNAETIRQLASQNAALREAVSNETINPFLPSQTDLDGDGVFDDTDAFPFDATESADSDNDGVGDNSDVFPNDGNEWLDTDNDGVGNNADSDDDNDGTPDSTDHLPLDPTEQLDDDSDGIGNNADELDHDPTEFLDSDLDGLGNRKDLDDDNDGVNDFADDDDPDYSKMFVVSAGNHRVLQYDLASGEFEGILIESQPGAYTLRSDIKSNRNGELYVIDFSDVAVFDRATREYKIAIDRSVIDSNFPGHILPRHNDELLVSHGFGNSAVARHSPFNDVKVSTELTADVFRDIEFSYDDNLFVVDRTAGMVWEYQLPNMSFIRSFLSSSEIEKPEQLIILENGQVLISDAADNNILLFSANGDYQRVFVDASQANLSSIGCMEMGPDGHLYVCSRETNQILKFDGASGEFISEVMNAQDGLLDPVGLAFAGGQLDEAPFDGSNDSDGDGVANQDDAFPLDAQETLDSDNDGIGNNADTDDDNDQMPDSFEDQYGFDPLDSSDASEDADGDGKSNLQEYLDGTDPTDAASVLKSKSGGSVNVALILILWLSIVGKKNVVAKKRCCEKTLGRRH